MNPLLREWETPLGTPPFQKIKPEHFKPAVLKAVKSAKEEIAAITENAEPPTFENTVAALDKIGARLGEITSILFNLNNAETTKDLQTAAREVSPILTRFSNDITLNSQLFRRIRTAYDLKNKAGLNTEQLMLLEKSYRNFILGGAGLKGKKKSRFREISEELARLSLRFEENVLEETNNFILHITDINDLDGLPEGIIEMASMEAKNREKDGWIFTLQAPCYIPFMQYSGKRNLREKMLKAYSSRAFHGDKCDNRETAKKIANLRMELADILGFKNFAELTLGDRMADTVDKVQSFLEELYSASGPAAHRDYDNIRNFALGHGHTGDIERWDWAYFSEKLKKLKYDFDDEMLKPYFSLRNMQEAVFRLASALYGIKFTRNSEIPVYHPEVETWEVFDYNGRFLAVLYIDYFPRPGKTGGAWMTSYREQRKNDGKDVRPFISVVANFTRATETRPSLLSFSELTTFLHEFGHSLHGMLTECTFESLSGTNVARDFVELPSQFMENFAYEKEWLSTWAVHYQTGEKIPDEMIDKIKAASTFNEGYACNRQLGFAFLDMAWHTLTSPATDDISRFELAAMARTELFPEVEGSSMSTSFSHIFAGGYAAGYYGYKWAEVLDADAFKYFKETGIFNKDTAKRFRKNILEKGGTDKPMNLYKKFRSKEPTIDAFLERSGLK